MNLDLGSFAFGSYLESGTGTPSWGTALGQSKPDYKFTYPGAETIIIGMVYCSVPLDNVSLPLGKGGRIYQASELKECQVASLFHKVYINGKKIDYPFVMVLIKENSDSHSGRKSIKYSDKNAYQVDNVHYSNQEFLRQARITLGLTDMACWFIYKFDVYNQDELHMSAVIVDKDNSITYDNSVTRRNEWIGFISETEKQLKQVPSVTNYLNSIQIIFYGAPGTGKSNTIKRYTDIAEEDGRVIRTTFHPDSDYSTFVGAYKPTMKESRITKDGVTITEEKIVYAFCPQAFTNAYVKAWSTTEDVYLVIEEINRGNCAQIFGDLFQLLDRKGGVSEYPVEADTDLRNYLQKELATTNREDIPEKVKSGEKLMLPKNLYIWATMNTSDQSLFPIDSAFKRRWEWKYMKIKNHPEENYRIKIGEGEQDWWEFIKKINEIIASMTSSADKQLGYFFCTAKDGVIDEETFVSKVIFYLWNDVFKDYGFEDASLFRYEDEKGVKHDLTVPDFYDENGEKVDIARLKNFVERVMGWKEKSAENG